ncbi:MAG: hypothetical protein GY839_20030 [candidate division Zixibacteria bacterium]|nr:hypothetical protein [candidate division Zixibacteria bacterium]
MNVLEIIESIFIILASIVAVLGVITWRFKMVGKKQYELAENILAKFYEAKDRLKYIRNPLSFRSKDDEEGHYTDATVERLENTKSFMLDLLKLKYQCMANFGSETGKLFDDFDNILDEISKSVHFLRTVTNMGIGSGSQVSDSTVDKIHESEAKIWRGIDGDKISFRLEKIIRDVERICKPVLKKRV